MARLIYGIDVIIYQLSGGKGAKPKMMKTPFDKENPAQKGKKLKTDKITKENYKYLL